jgi:hypothetical protein
LTRERIVLTSPGTWIAVDDDAVKRPFHYAVLAAISLFAVACSDDPKPKPASPPSASFRGVYTSTGDGRIGELAFLDDGTYVLRPSECHAVDCLEAGRASFDHAAKRLALGAHAFAVEVVTKGGDTSAGKIAPRDLVDRDAGLVDEAGVELTTITEAKLDGQPVQLVEQPAWPGIMPGTGPLRSPADGEVVTLHPGGNSVTVARPGDTPFVEDPALAQQYAGRANIYNSHGMPGILYGGIPESTVRSFLNDSTDPLIVASCFSGAGMSGGSTIRRLVSAYGSDPAAASRVYGCTGWTMASTQYGYACTGAWVDANQQAVPLVERMRLGLIQMRCGSNTIADQRPSWSDCHDPH